MTHDEALARSKEYLHLVDQAFINSKDEKENIQAVVPWDEGDGDWQAHVCFYRWPETGAGEITHMRVDEFLKTYQLIEKAR